MSRKGRLTIEYWKDGRVFVGKIREYPNVLSQGRTLKSLEENIRDALALMVKIKMVKVRADKGA